ncbi:MAG: hypothetical protein MAG431_02516 [Chloroflexi bacterium]|nr:hypothetical protein [Chloroflexota bacterium]
MKDNHTFPLISVLVMLMVITTLTGCDDLAEPTPAEVTATETPTPETQATIDAALTQTAVAEEEFQTAVDEAVDAAVEATLSAMSAVDVDSSEEMSEEEMAAEID